ncbi:MAG: hypothetical protein K6U87_03230 [Firmicutes bacterium]|nr:hypothetical protein [Bacillota bacterium]
MVSKAQTKRQIVAWLEARLDGGADATWIDMALGAVRRFVTWWQAAHHQGWNPRQWRPEDMAAYRQWVATQGLPAAQVAEEWAALDDFAGWLLAHGAICRHPMREAD